jgi:hypothetical protein
MKTTNRDWTNEERVTFYTKLLNIRESLVDNFDEAEKESEGTVLYKSVLRGKINNIARIAGLKKKIALYGTAI